MCVWWVCVWWLCGKCVFVCAWFVWCVLLCVCCLCVVCVCVCVQRCPFLKHVARCVGGEVRRAEKALASFSISKLYPFLKDVDFRCRYR